MLNPIRSRLTGREVAKAGPGRRLTYLPALAIYRFSCVVVRVHVTLNAGAYLESRKRQLFIHGEEQPKSRTSGSRLSEDLITVWGIINLSTRWGM